MLPTARSLQRIAAAIVGVILSVALIYLLAATASRDNSRATPSNEYRWPSDTLYGVDRMELMQHHQVGYVETALFELNPAAHTRATAPEAKRR